MNNINNDVVPTISGCRISFEVLMDLKIEHQKIYEEGAGEQIELLNYLYDILDNINSEIIKQNKQRIKAKYGSLLPPGANRNRTSQGGAAADELNNILPDDGLEDDNDGFQPVMPRRLANNSIKPGSGQQKQGKYEGRKPGRGRSSSANNSSYNQPYKPERERSTIDGNSPSVRSDYKSRQPNNINKLRQPNSGSVPLSSGGVAGFAAGGVAGFAAGGAGVLSRLMGVDKVKMAINREMNKLSSVNMEAIAESITDVFASWLLDELNNDIPVPTITEKFAKYLSELWTNLISKSLAQENMSEVYFKFLQRIINPYSSGQTIMACLRAKSPVMAGRLGTWQPGFYELSEYKSELLDEINTFLNQADYFEGELSDSGLAEKVGGVENLANIQQTFSILGLFAKYFIDIPSASSGRTRNVPSAWDIMLLAIYANFKLLNELLYWEPVNLEEVERRVFFTVGFLADNRGFIQSLDTDFYRDIECQLDSIKRCASIPTSVKYKLFDCIDNFILMRKSGSGSGARK